MVKTATMRYSRQSAEEEENEIKELENKRLGVKEESEEEEEEPAHAEEKTFKKRYGDLRRHLQRKEDEYKTELTQVRDQLETLTKTQVRLPKTDEEIDEWSSKYPDVAKVVETIAAKKATQTNEDIQRKLSELAEVQQQVKRDKAETELSKLHPDFDDIRADDSFHVWASEQPKMIQTALYENDDDPIAASKAIDLYKLETGIKTSKPRKATAKDAATLVNSSRRQEEPSGEKKAKWSESKVRKLSGNQWDKHSDEISEAISSGNFLYDETGGAR
tara:strand:- start:157 stop:981 length:825 start_codon:yes stop_codon:yes gene_type:complete